MDKFTKILKEAHLDSDAQQLVQEAWNEKLNEAREQVSAELRQEFAKRYEHDKGVIAEAVENFVNAELQEAIAAQVEEASKLKEARKQFAKDKAKQLKVMEQFVLKQLAKEINECQEDRKRVMEAASNAKEFIRENLSTEIAEFNAEKKALTEQRVKLLKEGRAKIAQARSQFIKRASKSTQEIVETVLRKEMKDLREDIREAKQNEFGRKLFEAFAGEFGRSHLAEGTELGKQRADIAKLSKQVAALTESVQTKDTELAVSKDLLERTRTMARLMKPLGGEKRAVMEGLLESVQTKNLETAFKKYLPTVLGEQRKSSANGKQPLRESRAKKPDALKARDGNRRTQLNEENQADVVELEQIKRLAGLGK